MYSRKLLLLPHSEIFQPIHVLLHTLLNRKPRFPSKVLKRTLNAQCAQIVISQVAGANMDRCSGKQFASLINNTCVGNHLSAANIIFGINHYNFDQRIDLDDIMNQGNVKSWKGRSHLTAMLSEDDGETWPYTLLLDERNEVSYPDAKEADNGYIYVTRDKLSRTF